MNTRNRLCPMVVALFLLYFICATASAEIAQGTETQITTSESDQVLPDIYGERIVWIDYSGNVYMYDLSTSVETLISSGAQVLSPAIYCDLIVWQDSRSGNTDIYMYDLSTHKETQITNNKSHQTYPAVYGDRIVWQDWRNGNWDIYTYDLLTHEESQITTSEFDQMDLAIYGDRMVWEDNRNGIDIYMYDLSTHKETRITKSGEANNPDIYGDRIVWVDVRNGMQDIYMYDLSTHKESRISTSGEANFPAIYGDRIVWEDYRNRNGDIYMYDISTSTEYQITTNELNQYHTAIYGDRIVWDDPRNGNSDIYMFTVTSAKLTPLDSTHVLRDYVETTFSCDMGTKKVLTKHLDTSIRFLEKGKDSKAVCTLESFIHLVENMDKCNRVSADEANYMITEARGIIDQIKAQ